MNNNYKKKQPISPERLIHALNDAVEKLEMVEREKRGPIAIVGMSCRFPGGVNGPASFWQLLRNGINAISEVPKDRWDLDCFYDPDPDVPGKMYTRFGGFLDNVDCFDPGFFGISPRETVSMDPQQRLLLEVSWEALENAGMGREKFSGSKTGVFVGVTTHDYKDVLTQFCGIKKIDNYFGSGNTLNAIAGRLSFTLGLQGPSMAIDTACSSSLVASHLACQSLRSGESDLALVGGVNLILTPEPTVALSKARMLSFDGRCKTFDAAADGYVRGEGCGVIVLKRLSDAEADGDKILALIKGSAANQDGPSSGFTVPNGPAQQELIRKALSNARVKPCEVDYVEAHGTGTSLGDPIEVSAAAAVLGEGRPDDRPFIMGAVKTNLGHLEAAAGIAGIIKVVLSLQNEEIPPHLNFNKPSPHIPWSELPVRVPTGLIPWPKGGKKRLAGVSSFGASGTNTHLILEEAPPEIEKKSQENGQFERPIHLLTLSAKTAEALKELAGRYVNHISACPDSELKDICFSANTGRSHFPGRLTVMEESLNGVKEKLAGIVEGRGPDGVFQGQVKGTRKPKIAFLFTGQGSQYKGMGRLLYETQPTFRRAIDNCHEILNSYVDINLLEILYPGLQSGGKHGLERVKDSDEVSQSENSLNETGHTQPALFALEYALAELWKSWGIMPSAVMGHSVGEYVAACVAGVFSLEDGLRLIAERGRLMQALPDGGEMVAVLAGEERVVTAIQPYKNEISIAAVNGPKNVVISGKRSAIRALCQSLKSEGTTMVVLKVSHAFHSPLMGPMLGAFENIVREVTFASPRINLISNANGQLDNKEIATPEYWVDHIQKPVRFADSMATLNRENYKIFLEIGPKPVLMGMGCQCLPENTGIWLPSLRQGGDDWQNMLSSLSQLYVHGVDVNWQGFDRDYPRRRLHLPTYPFQRQRYWIEQIQNRNEEGDEDKQLDSGQELKSTSIINSLQKGDIDKLSEKLMKTQDFSKESQKLVPRILETLFNEHQKELFKTSLKDLLYEVEWLPLKLPVIQNNIIEKKSDYCLIFADNQGVGKELQTLLRSRDKTCMLVFPGKEYEQSAEHEFIINPGNPSDFDRLLTGLENKPLCTVVHMWSLDTLKTEELTDANLRSASHYVCASSLYLLQSLLKKRVTTPPALWLITRGAVSTKTSPNVPGLAQSPLWGMGKVMALEHPELKPVLVDLGPEAQITEEANALCEEICSGGKEDQIVFRDKARYVARLINCRQTQTETPQLPIKLNGEATYLITGGLGALGLLMADWLISHGARHLTLVGRRGITQTVKPKIEKLKKAGAQVLVVQADISQHDQVVKVLAEIKESQLTLKGIIHAAGVLDDGVLSRLSWEGFENVMGPKVEGAWNLHVLTKDVPLDFFILFSSISSLIGSPGQSNYAAANAFMDALAHYRCSIGLVGMSINWSAWADAGMASEQQIEKRIKTKGIETIGLSKGLQVMEYLFSQPLTQVGVIPVDWSHLTEYMNGKPFFTNFQQRPEKAKSLQSGFLELLENAQASKRKTLLVSHVRSCAAKILGLNSAEQVDPQEGFFELGMDSLTSVEFRNRLQASLEHNLPATLAFDYPNVEVLVDYLIQEVHSLRILWGPTKVLQNKQEEQFEGLENLDQLSEDEIGSLIDEELVNVDRYVE